MSQGQAIAFRVKEVLEQIPAEARRLGVDANGAWTLLIKEQLAQLGDAMDYQVCTPGAASAAAGPGSLDRIYDMTWLQMANGGTDLTRVPLVFESEWYSSRDEQIGDDFQELLEARADVRVMVFQQRTASEVQQIMDALERQVQAFEATQPGDLILLCGYDWHDTQRFAFRTVAT